VLNEWSDRPTGKRGQPSRRAERWLGLASLAVMLVLVVSAAALMLT